MTENTLVAPALRLKLWADTAEDLMTPNPLSLRANASLREAVAFLIDRGISGAPVIDEAGRPVGVLTQTDLLIHDRETVEYLPAPEETGAPLAKEWWDEFQFEKVDGTTVRELMTPVVFAVPVSLPATDVIEQMVELRVHRLFVVDANGILVGVITPLDVLRHLDHRPR